MHARYRLEWRFRAARERARLHPVPDRHSYTHTAWARPSRRRGPRR
ncbi:hypothetical protein ATKI12_4382 [Kitasatospora sp. Ki12]